MALTSNNCRMIEAISKNDMYTARKAAIASLSEDKTKKNEWFTERYKKILSSAVRDTMQSIPSKLIYKLAGELPEDFLEERYYLSEEGKEIYEQVYRMNKTSLYLSSLKIRYSNSTLLYGESGTGKTMLAKYIAYKMDLPFFYMNFSHMIDSYMGQTSLNISEAFKFVRQTPCVFMIDEMDCIASKRSMTGGKGPDGELERTTIGIMQELDTLPNTVILIGATNRKDLLDEAILTRFMKKYEIKPFTEEQSLAMVKKFINDKRLEDAGIIFSEEELQEIVRTQKIQRLIISELISRISMKAFELMDFEEEPHEPLNTGAYRVRFTYDVIIDSDDMDEALSMAKREYQMKYFSAESEIMRI